MSGQSFIITGATGPVAPAVVAALAERGDRLLLTGRNEERLRLLEKEFGKPGEVEVFVGDIGVPEQARAAAAQARERFGRLNGLVHLVGGFHAGPVQMSDESAYTSMFHTNVMTAVTATKAVLGQVTPPAYLVYMASILALEPLPGMTAYTATKAALLALVRGLAHEVKGRGIHANAIVSSMVDSPHARASRPTCPSRPTWNASPACAATGSAGSTPSSAMPGRSRTCPTPS